MILFKRVGESFRQIDGREWLLLFLETLGVLVGILLAFELQEWGQRRAEEARHRQLMARLFEESELDVAVLRDMRDLLNGLLDGERKFAAALGNGRCPPQSEWEAVQNVGKLPALTAPTFVYQELMGAGGLSAVERKDVRQALAVFHRDLDWTQQQVAYFRQSNQDPISTSDPRVTIFTIPQRTTPRSGLTTAPPCARIMGSRTSLPPHSVSTWSSRATTKACSRMPSACASVWVMPRDKLVSPLSAAP